MSEPIAFLDLEASGLGPKSWPIEVGWGLVDGAVQSLLIRPSDDWPRDQWDTAAEALHGIKFNELTKNGRPIADVCAQLNAALAGKIVYSDAPDWDGFWLFRLFDAGGVRQEFALRDFAELLRNLVIDDIFALSVEAEKTHPHNHRAHDDVRHMHQVYKLALKAASGR